MAKVKTYDYNRAENTLTVTYESGTVRKYSADRLPKSVHTFICEDVVYCTISSLIDEYKAEKALLIPVLHNSSISSDIYRDASIKSSALFHKYYTLRELFLNLPVSELCYEIRYFYSYFSDVVSSEDEFYVRFRECYVLSLEAIKELAKRLHFSPNDEFFELTFSHILSIKFPETAPTETIPTELPESSDNEPATEETTPAVSEPTETVPESASSDNVTFDQSYNELLTEETTPAKETSSEVSECQYCPECIYYKTCSSHRYCDDIQRHISLFSCFEPCCCSYIPDVDYIYEEQKKTEPAYDPEVDLDCWENVTNSDDWEDVPEYEVILDDADLPF